MRVTWLEVQRLGVPGDTGSGLRALVSRFLVCGQKRKLHLGDGRMGMGKRGEDIGDARAWMVRHGSG